MPDADDMQPAADEQTPEGAEAVVVDGDDDVYEQAFTEFLGDAVTPSKDTETPPSDDSGSTPPADDSDAEPDQLAEEDVQLLRRQHLSPEAFKQLPAEARQEFLQNARKREADNAKTYQQLKQENERLKAGKATQDSEGDGEGDDSDETTPAEQPSDDVELSEEEQKLVDEVVDNYGDELRPLAEDHAKARAQLRQVRQNLETSEQSRHIQARLLIDHIADSTLDGLEADFPSLQDAEARQKVIARFQQDYNSNPSEEDANTSLARRMRAGLKAAAEATFSGSDAASTRDRKRNRLSRQPSAGSRRGQPRPKDEDEAYNRAFSETLGKELR